MADQTQPPFSRSERRARRCLLMAVVALVVAPLTFFHGPAEWSKWQLAALVEEYYQGNEARALEKLSRLARQHPDVYAVQRRLAQWLVDHERADEALRICERWIEIRPDDSLLQSIRYQALVNLQRFDEALEIIQAIEDSRDRPARLQLRAAAYLRALANRDLDTALDEVNEALLHLELAWAGSFSETLTPVRRAYLLTAVLHSQMENHELARQFISELIADLEVELSEYSPAHRYDLYDWYDFSTFHPWQLHDSMEIVRQQLQRNLAVAYSVRAKVLQHLGTIDASRQDIQYVIDFDHDPESLLQSLPDYEHIALGLYELVQFLDTRGVIYFRLGDHRQALIDIQAAIAGIQAVRAAFEHLKLYEPAYHDFTDVHQILDEFERRPRKTLARLLYHRSWIHAAVGDDVRQQTDLQQIRELGFRPGPHLN